MSGKQTKNLEEAKTFEVISKRGSETALTDEYEKGDDELVDQARIRHGGYSMYCRNCSSKITKVVNRSPENKEEEDCSCCS